MKNRCRHVQQFMCDTRLYPPPSKKKRVQPYSAIAVPPHTPLSATHIPLHTHACVRACEPLILCRYSLTKSDQQKRERILNTVTGGGAFDFQEEFGAVISVRS